ncbi:MAG: hypothetical protein ACK4NX_01380 [Candidatus Paceibacteria bacterium]
MKRFNKEEGLIFLLKDSYLKMIENSVGSRLFKNLYFKRRGKQIDVLRNGKLSCAVFVSWILRNFYLIKDIHTTVNGTREDLKKSGWRKIDKPKIGSVLVWEEKKFKDGGHKHIGFYIDKKVAISNGSKKGLPQKHHWTFGVKNGKPIRPVTEIWWHRKLE